MNVAVPADTAAGTETLLVATATSTDEPTVTNSATAKLMTSIVANALPVANAGPDQVMHLGKVVTLNGSKSFDPDNSPAPLSFAWVQIAGPAAILTGANTATPSFTPTAAGRYTFTLVVDDGEANSIPDDVTITVLKHDGSIPEE